MYKTFRECTRLDCNWTFKWLSSDRLHRSDMSCSGRNKGPYATNFLMYCAILVSGSQYSKINKFFKFLNAECVSERSYIKISRKLEKVIFWYHNRLQEMIITEISLSEVEGIKIAGDGQVRT